MSKSLPVKLTKEPLVEAACQLHVTSRIPLNMIFPGFLLGKYPQDVSQPQQLPMAMVPEQVRAAQPQMAFAPLVRIRFKEVLLMIGERSITISNPAPYLGWPHFKGIIVEVLTKLFESGLVSTVNRYSLKYTNVLKTGETPEPLSALAWDLSIGQLDLNRTATTLRTETLADDGVVTVITISGGVTVQAEGREAVQGTLIDIDAICQNQPKDVESFASSMNEELDRVRRVNKKVFFECLTDQAIRALGPSYE
jgi:uncharacterized protein (TIGR04255 family)